MKKENLWLAMITVKWLAVMAVLSISFHVFGEDVLRNEFGIQLSQFSKNIILAFTVIVPYLLGARELTRALRKKRNELR